METKHDINKFKQMVGDLGLSLSDEQYDRFIQYYELLIKWNEVMNLTAITDYDEVVTKHFVGFSVHCKGDGSCEFCRQDSHRCGDGSGLPGYSLKDRISGAEGHVAGLA